MAAVQPAEQFDTRELLLNVTAGRVRFTKAIVDVYPPGPLAVVHYCVDGVPQQLGSAIDLDKQAFLDACDQADILTHAPAVTTAILEALHAIRA